MKLKRNEEIINHPCQNWTDEDGVKWSRPTLAFLQAQGFAEYVEFIEPTPLTLDQIKFNKLSEISSAFDNEMRSGIVTTDEGWPIDARRSDTKNDLQNMQVLYNKMIRDGLESTYIKGADNQLHECTLNNVSNFIILLENTATDRYAKKFNLEIQIDNAITIQDVELISW